MTLSHSRLAASPSGRAATSSLTTSNSPRKSASLSFSSSYLSMRRRSRLTPGTVSMRPSKEADSWNSLKRQVETHPVVERDKPTWQLTMTGQLTLVPMRAVQRASKSGSRGEAELQTGDAVVSEAGEFLLETLNNVMEAD